MNIREASDKGEPPVALGNDTIKEYYQNIVSNILDNTDFNL